jgi:energy-coupling factor transporter ATP-binding protein EcfA2
MNDSISSWLNSQHPWIQEAAYRILSKSSIDDSDIADFVAMIKAHKGGNKGAKTIPRTYPEFGVGSAATKAIRLKSIGDIVGIDKLTPKTPLVFSTGNLCVVYGNNGSGKSGYARILKRACGKAGAQELKGDVFGPELTNPRCSISFEVDTVPVSKKWGAKAAPIDDLKSVDIFDAAGCKSYLEAETSVSFSPPQLVLFTDLAEVYRRVEGNFSAEQTAHKKVLPLLPKIHEGTDAGNFYNSLKPKMAPADLGQLYPWTDQDQEKLIQLVAKKAVKDPAEEAKKKRATKKEIDLLRVGLLTARAAVAPNKQFELLSLSINAKTARAAATGSAAVLSKRANLQGLGTATWIALWDAARRYSEDVAYVGSTFPNTADGAKCVLCQQELDTVAANRLSKFEAYVTGELEVAAQSAESAFQKGLEELPMCSGDEILTTSCQAAGLPEEISNQVKAAWSDVRAVVVSLNAENLDIPKGGIVIPDCPLLSSLDSLSLRAKIDTKSFDSDALTFDGQKIANEIRELEAKKWVASQKDAIDFEIQRLNAIAEIAEWSKETSTIGLSKRASELSKTLITEAYVQRFNNELLKLGASRIKVELVKTGAKQGEVKHRVQLLGQGVRKVADILSDGEQRVVILAAFLATVSAKSDKSPFVFDDPISSLDQDYEEKTIQRLVELSADRQVIVFTHRLSLVGMMEKAASGIVAIKHEVWGAGQPGEFPIFGKNPKSALMQLRNERLPQARNALHASGQDAYYPLASAICTDLRKVMERIVEVVLLSDIVQRHRREIQTKGKVEHLAKISSADCILIDKFMTRYSVYEHSQSLEAPVLPPTPDDLLVDLDQLIAWHDEFKNRAAG